MLHKEFNLRPSNYTAFSIYFVRMAKGHLSTKRRLIRKEIDTASDVIRLLCLWPNWREPQSKEERAWHFFADLLQMTNLWIPRLHQSSNNNKLNFGISKWMYAIKYLCDIALISKTMKVKWEREKTRNSETSSSDDRFFSIQKVVMAFTGYFQWFCGECVDRQKHEK